MKSKFIHRYLCGTWIKHPPDVAWRLMLEKKEIDDEHDGACNQDNVCCSGI